jgi:hypothetical protein
MVTAALRCVFAQESAEQIESRWNDLAALLAERFTKAAVLMHEAKEDVLAFRHFPKAHWKKVWSTILLEWVNEEIKCSTRVVGIFPNDAANGLRLTVSTPARWGRCCWSSTSIGSWRAAACSPPTAWPPSRSLMTSLHSWPSAPERGCKDHSSSQHIGARTKDLTTQLHRLIVEQRCLSEPPE